MSFSRNHIDPPAGAGVLCHAEPFLTERTSHAIAYLRLRNVSPVTSCCGYAPRDCECLAHHKASEGVGG